MILRARVVLREGPLEHLLCLKGTKEHEAILATDAVPGQIHAGLLLTGAERATRSGSSPSSSRPTGTPIAIALEWTADGKTQTRRRPRLGPRRTRQGPLKKDWVFAGSELIADPDPRRRSTPPMTATCSPSPTSPARSSTSRSPARAHDAERSYVARTAVLPPVGTRVLMILQPRPPALHRNLHRPRLN